MKVAVVGASGGMGSFFVRYFLSQHFEVRGSDIDRKRVRARRFRQFTWNSEAVRGAKFVVLVTPIDETIATATEVLPSMSPGSTLVEISSVKGGILPELTRMVSSSGKKVLSTHPLFGPSNGSFEHMKILVVSSRVNSDLRSARKLFPGATLIPIGRRQHDRLMAVTLSLHHALSLVYAGTLRRFISPAEFRDISTPNSLIQLTLAEAVLSQSPSLYSYIQVNNEHSRLVLDALLLEAERVRKLVRAGDRKRFERYFKELSVPYSRDARSQGVPEKVFQLSRVLQNG